MQWADCRGFISKEYGKKYLPELPLSYTNKDNAQAAHEAIRPSDVSVKPNQVSNVDRDAERLYNLIWRQFVACQMTNAKFSKYQCFIGRRLSTNYEPVVELLCLTASSACCLQ